MKHKIEFTTTELMMIRFVVGKRHFSNAEDIIVASEIIDKIDSAVKRDLPKMEQIKEKK